LLKSQGSADLLLWSMELLDTFSLVAPFSLFADLAQTFVVDLLAPAVEAKGASCTRYIQTFSD
jgi:hypothetical protein